MSNLYLNPHLFFLIENQDIIVWNYKSNEQYQIEDTYFLELVHISKTHHSKNAEIAEELLQGGLVFKEKPTHPEWEWDILGKIYHIGTNDLESPLEEEGAQGFSKIYLQECAGLSGDLSLFQEKEGPLIKLPKPDLSHFENASLMTILKNRKTCREFYAKPITLEMLSSILYASFGLIHQGWNELSEHGLKEVGIRKASPSGGGIHPEEAYVVVYHVSGLKPGLYYYRPQDHAFTLLKSGNFEKEVIQLNLSQFYSEGLAFGIYMTARFDKSWWKYKNSRAYRMVLLDIGHASQTFQLCASAYQLYTWITGAFHDSKVIEFLNIDNPFEYPIFFVGAGHGSGKAIHPMMLEAMSG